MKGRIMLIGAAMVLLAISLVGVGYAAMYTFSTENSGNTASNEYILADIGDEDPLYKGFLSGTYTLNTVTGEDADHNTVVTLVDLKKDGEACDPVEDNRFRIDDASNPTAIQLNYNTEGTALDAPAGYTSYLIGTRTVSITKASHSDDASVLISATVPQTSFAANGLSLIYTIDIDGDGQGALEQVVTPEELNGGVQVQLKADMTQNVTISAYAVYKDTATHKADLEYSAFKIAEQTITITVSDDIDPTA
jgi:hypothetical protein